MLSDPAAMSDLPTESDADAELTAALRLALVAGIGPRHWQSLVAHFGGPRAVLAASMSQLRELPGIGPKLSRQIAAADQEIDASAELELCRANGIDIRTSTGRGYPRTLLEIPDPPPLLFVQGTVKPCDELAIAIVGSRHATHYGLTQAERLAGSLARAGLTIISGLARDRCRRASWSACRRRANAGRVG